MFEKPSLIFLHKTLLCLFHKAGVVVVGLGDLLNERNGGDNPLVGDIISVVSTFFYAAQLCYEEKVPDNQTLRNFLEYSPEQLLPENLECSGEYTPQSS